jgi:Tfp pilus assembly protein PilX
MRLWVSRLRSASLHSVAPRRRTGQALLLAVLIMIFVALVGATFITVVSLNMDATATQEERQKAASAANAGMEVINYQINANGTDWRPEKIAPPPAPGDPEYAYYWTAQDIAQGYARTTSHAIAGETWGAAGVTGGDWDKNGVFQAIEDDWAKMDYFKSQAPARRLFVKFPDPRLEQNTGSHTYMAEVAVTGTGEGTDKEGMLRITVVGQSSDDPNVFVKRVAYKGTSQNNGAFAWDQFFTNWNYAKQKNVTTTALAFTLNNAVVPPIQTITPQLSDLSDFAPGRLITIQQGNLIENAIVKSVNIPPNVPPNTPPNTLTLSASLTNTFTAGASVRGASPLMNGLIGQEGPAIGEASQFNADGVGTVSDWEKTQDQYRSLGYGLMSNSDLQLIGKVNYALNANALTSKFHVAGTIMPAPGPTGAAPVHARFNDGSTNGAQIPTSYSYNGTVTVGSGTGQQLQVADNPNPTQTEDLTQTSHNVRPITPPDISSFPRLLEMTKYSPRGIEGLGAGVYINNPDDFEKVSENAAGASPYRPLSISDMHRLWLGKSFPASANGNCVHGDTFGVATGTTGHRLIFPRITPGDDGYAFPLTVGSLEQRGIRGWVNTFEFVPRGAKVDIITPPGQPTQTQIVITLDDRSDNVAYAPDSAKAWLYTRTNNMPNCYRMVINTNTNQRSFGAPGFEVPGPAPTDPFNGVIFAEGNIRVRGRAGTKNLTIVSMNNIYVEGNLVQTPAGGRIALLARKNVVLNPTQFTTTLVGAQDRDVATQSIPVTVPVGNTGTGATDANALTVSTIGTFREGDYIRVEGDTTWRQVVRKTTSAPIGLVLKPPFPTNAPPAANSFIRIKSVAATVTQGSTGNTVTVNSKTPFRVGDYIRVGTNNWALVTAIDPAADDPDPDFLTLSTPLTAVVGDSVQILADPDFVPGANLSALAAISTANGWPVWPSASVPTGSTTGDHFESPEWFYRLSSPRDVLTRDVRFDGVTPGAAVGGVYHLSTRMVGERKLAYMLHVGANPPSQPYVRISQNSDGNTTINAAELHFVATTGSNANPNNNGQGNPAPGKPNQDFTFDYDLLNFLPPVGANPDNTQTMAALRTEFNDDQFNDGTNNGNGNGGNGGGNGGVNGNPQQQWELKPRNPIMSPNFDMDANEAQSIAARYFLPLGINAGTADDWAPIDTNDPRRLYLSTSARQIVGTTLNFASATFDRIGAAPTANDFGDVSTSRGDRDLTTRSGFYFYMHPGNSSNPTHERQQWIRWSSRPMGTTVDNASNIVALTMNSAVNGGTGSLAPLRATAFKFERSGFDAPDNNYSINAVGITVQATIFAQEGSWFAIPAPLQHRNDLDNDSNTSVSEISETSFATRMRRPNYNINVQGRIIQNFAPPALSDYDSEQSFSGSTAGAVAQWADALSHPREVYVVPIDATTNSYRGRNWNTITYQVESQIPVNWPGTTPPLMLPPSPELSFAS